MEIEFLGLMVHSLVAKEARPDLALDLFWQHQQQCTEMSNELYGAILEACARCNGFALAVLHACLYWDAPEEGLRRQPQKFSMRSAFCCTQSQCHHRNHLRPPLLAPLHKKSLQTTSV
eukprot:4646920-Amphidinium_carterae.1